MITFSPLYTCNFECLGLYVIRTTLALGSLPLHGATMNMEIYFVSVWTGTVLTAKELRVSVSDVNIAFVMQSIVK